MFEELIRKFAEISNETAGEHFTPREVIRLMVNLLFIEDDEALSRPGVVRSLYDPTAGTGGMLSVADEHLGSMNADARLVMFGQELNAESYAICKADMLIKGQDVANIILGNTLSNDGLHGKQFDYSLSNPPFGVEWKKIEAFIRKEFETQGFNGRFGPGLPRVSDGSLLFLLRKRPGNPFGPAAFSCEYRPLRGGQPQRFFCGVFDDRRVCGWPPGVPLRFDAPAPVSDEPQPSGPAASRSWPHLAGDWPGTFRVHETRSR